MIKPVATVLSLWALFGAFVCQTEIPATSPPSFSSTANSDDGIGRRELSWSMREQKAMRIVYSEATQAAAPHFRKLAQEVKKGLPKDWKLTLLSENEVTEAALRDIPLLIIGRRFENPALQALLAELPFHNKDDHFTFHQHAYKGQEQSFRLSFYPNPHSRTPVFWIGGNSDAAITAQLASESTAGAGNPFWRGWGYEIYEGREVIVRGNLTDKSWAFDPDQHFDFSRQVQLDVNSKHFRFHDLAGLGREFIGGLAEACENKLQELYAFTGSKRPIAPIDYYLYPTIEDKGLRLMNSEVGQLIREKREVHVVINATFRGQHTHRDIQLILHDLLGQGSKAVLDQGLPAHFNLQWQEKGVDHWAARLYQSDNLPSLSELLDDEVFLRGSPLVMTAAAGSLAGFLIGHWGQEAFLGHYRKWPELSENALAELEHGWHQYLSNIPAGKQETAAATVPYYLGFNFAHEGYQIYNGYGSTLAGASLEKLRDIGANAVAIVPYGFQRDPKQPAFLSVHHGAGGENDESVIYSHAQARQLGMYTLLKPQLWVSGAWPGEVEMATDADWAAFFDYYYQWIRHYALLAEMYQFDAFCVGVEFTRATLAKPEAWRQIIRRLRGLYSGPITYAANWGEEFEQLSFWDELDFIGLNCYYPLSQGEQPGKKELKKAFAEVLKKAERISDRYHRPLVLTEVGFRSVQHSWKNPHAEADGRPYDPECQRVCYEVLFEGLNGKDWIKGLFLWKWPSYLAHEEGNPDGFSPGGKPAEAVVTQWFGTEMGREE